MKKILKYAAVLAAILPVSCNKDMNPSEGLAPEGKTVKVTMNVETTDVVSKMALSGKRFQWEVGDELKIRFTGGAYTDATDCGVLTAQISGAEATFEGELKGIGMYNETQVNNMYAFYSEDGQFQSATATSTYEKTFSSVQTGKVQDLKNHAFWGTWIERKMMKVTEKDTDGNPTAIELYAVMYPKFSVIQFNVPEELNLTQIKIEADAPIAGKMRVNAARKPNHTDGPSAHMSRVAAEGSTNITVFDNGQIISGDVYVVIAPDTYDSRKTPTETSYDIYESSAKSLKFTLTDNSGNTSEFTSNLSDPIQMGELKPLGTLPLNVMLPKVEPGTLGLVQSTDMKIVLNNANASCDYYYEIANSADECKTPTINSNRFDAENGLSLELPNEFDRRYIKVLAHSKDANYRDVVLRASLRNWKFGKGTEIASVLKAADEGTTLETTAAGTLLGDGLFIYRTKLGTDNATSITYEETAVRCGYSSAFVSTYIITEYNSNVWLYFNVDKSISIRSGTTCNYNLYVNKATSRVNTYKDNEGNEYTCKNSEYTSDGTSQKVNVCWNLGRNDVGDMFAFSGDRKHNIYSMAMLEVL